jgi:hypothetical protein
MTERKFTPFVEDGTMTEYITRDGQPARVCVSNGTNVINGFFWYPNINEWTTQSWYADGSASASKISNQDLFDVPVKHTRWVNVYPLGDDYSITTSFLTKEGADRYGALHRIACIQVTFEEGEGL